MKRLLLVLVVVGLGGLIWYSYHVGWLVAPTSRTVAQQGDAAPQGDGTARRRWRHDGAAQPDAAATPADAQPPARRGGQRGAGRGRPGGDDGPVPVLAAEARYDNVPVTIDAVGTIQALNTVTVRSQVDGRLLELDFKDGQDVKSGDILARIDPATYQAQYDQAVAKKAQDEALLANARVDLDRYAKLATTEYGSRQQADTQKSLVTQLEAQTKVDQGVIDNDKAILAYTIIKAPIDGRTGIRMIDAGNIIHASDAVGIVSITQLQPIAMIFSLPQQHLAALNTAMAKAEVPVEALDSDNMTVLEKGAVEVVDNQVDQTTGTIRVKATFPNADRHLWPGQFVNVRLFVDTLAHVVVIPTPAVQRGPNGTYVYVVNDDGTVKLTPVKVGRQDETIAVVQSGVEPPARVVTTGFAQLTDGAHVVVADQTAASRTPALPGTAPDAAAVTPAAAPGPAAPAAADGDKGPPSDGAGEPRRHHRRQQPEAAPPGATQ